MSKHARCIDHRNAQTSRCALLTAAVTAALLVSTGCKYDEPPFDPRAIQRSERDPARDVRPGAMRPLPTTLESTFLPPRAGEKAQPTPTTAPTTGPNLEERVRVRMPLQEVIHRAVANNLDVRVAGYAPAIESTRAIEAEARFDPTVFSNLNFERRNNSVAFNTATSADGRDQQNVATGQVGIRQFLQSGGQIELRHQTVFNDVKQDDSPFGQNVNPDPFWESQLVLQLTQPLLQNFGNDVNRARITISRNNQRISLLDFRRQLEESLADVEQTYWLLAQAERDVMTAERLLSETLRTADILLKRYGQDVTRVQISQANASVEERRAVLIRAKSRVEDLSDQLKRLMNDPEIPVSSAVLILPNDVPVEQPFMFTLEDSMDVAMVNRFELGQQQLRINSANVAANVARNNELPLLNFIGQVGYQGLGDSFHQGFHNQWEFNNLNYQIGLQFEMPIGNRAARAVTRRALLQQMQAIDQYRLLVDTISFDVKRALREIETSWNQMAARRQARFAAADSLSAIEQREAGGEQLSPTFVNLKLDSQERLAEAKRQEDDAVAAYNIAISRLELAKGTLLRYNNVMMEEAPLRTR